MRDIALQLAAVCERIAKKRILQAVDVTQAGREEDKMILPEL